MPFRAPKNFWEWVLLFSPALVIWLASAIWLSFPHRGDVGVLLVGPFIGSAVALVLCFFCGIRFTNPTPKPSGRHLARLASASLIAVLNLGIAFGGCAVVLR